MSQTLSSQRMAAPPIRVLIIRPDSTYEVREVEQDIRTMQGLVGGHIAPEPIYAEPCTFWRDRCGELKGRPTNAMATYLWWKADPSAEGQDVLQGTVFVTGVADDCFDSLPVPDEVIDLFERLELIYREHRG